MAAMLRRVAAWAVVTGVLAALFVGFSFTQSIDLAHVKGYEKSFSLWASAATVAGIGFGSVTFALGVISFRAAQRASRLAHMHGLFRELMRFKAVDLPVASQTAGTLVTTGYILYALEEIWDAIVQEERSSLFVGRSQFIRDWKRTVRSHICEIAPDEMALHLDSHADCYGEAFLKKISQWVQCTKVASIIDNELQARDGRDENCGRTTCLPKEDVNPVPKAPGA